MDLDTPESVIKIIGSSLALSRRKELLDAMAQSVTDGVGCASCSGPCCTFVANSMQVTPIEAFDLYGFLVREGRFDSVALEKNAQRFGLDRPAISAGQGRYVRRRYTCPFHSEGPLGCSIDPEHKPYGCLGFNPRGPGVKEGEDCGSDQELLERRESRDEGNLNQLLRESLGIAWEKESIPVALLELHTLLKTRGQKTRGHPTGSEFN
jgi:hypothetical protein